MKPAWETPASLDTGRSRGAGLLPIVLVVVFSGLSWIMLGNGGLPALALLAVGSLGVLATGYFLLRYPILVCLVWFLSMSGLQTLGMLRMPGLPDFSLARMFMVLMIVMGPLGIIMGRAAFRPPYAPDLLIVLHAFYVLVNMYLIGNGDRFNTWMASSLAPVVGFLFAKQFVAEERQLKAITLFFALISVYFWVTCVGEKFSIPALVWPKAILDRKIGIAWFGRSRGPFLQPGMTGQFLGWYMMAQVYLLTRRTPTVWRIVLVLNIVACGIGLLFTYTRGAWLATVVGFLAMAALRPRYRKIFGAVAVAGVLMFATSFLRPGEDEFLGERLQNTSTIENRLGFLAAAARMIQERPLFGVGYFRYMELAPQYIHGAYIPLYGYVSRSAGENVPIHDMIIGRTAEEGIVSTALVFAIGFVFYREFRRRWNSDPRGSWFDRDFLAFYGGVMASYVVNGLTLDYRYFDLVNVLPFFLTGVVIGWPRGIVAPGRQIIVRSRWTK